MSGLHQDALRSSAPTLAPAVVISTSASSDISRRARRSAACAACPVRDRCTSSPSGRTISIHPREAVLQRAKRLAVQDRLTWPVRDDAVYKMLLGQQLSTEEFMELDDVAVEHLLGAR